MKGKLMSVGSIVAVDPELQGDPHEIWIFVEDGIKIASAGRGYYVRPLIQGDTGSATVKSDDDQIEIKVTRKRKG